MCIKWYCVLEYVYYYVLKCICKYVFEYIKYVYVHIYEPSTCFKWYLWIIGNFCMSVSTDILPEIDLALCPGYGQSMVTPQGREEGNK